MGYNSTETRQRKKKSSGQDCREKNRPSAEILVSSLTKVKIAVWRSLSAISVVDNKSHNPSVLESISYLTFPFLPRTFCRVWRKLLELLLRYSFSVHPTLLPMFRFSPKPENVIYTFICVLNLVWFYLYWFWRYAMYFPYRHTFTHTHASTYIHTHRPISKNNFFLLRGPQNV